MAVQEGIARSGVSEDVVGFEPAPATREALERAHPARYLDAVEALCERGPGAIDADTRVSGPASWEAALVAAGAGLDAVARLDRGEADSAFLAVRPPGHHATPSRPMGFCLLNNVAVTAAALAERGEQVLVVDWDVHHGNGTQEIFFEDPRVLYVSFHQYPFYPGTGAATETGRGPGAGSTINVPFSAGTAGDAYRYAIDEVIVPAAEGFGATWLVASAGFDAHRDDPLAELELSAGDFFDITARVMALVPPGRRIAFLEGGYDAAALADSVSASVAALAGVREARPEPPTSGDIGLAEVDAVRSLRAGL